MRRIVGLFTAAVACFGAGPDPAQVLERLKVIVREQAPRVPNYTCVQTIDRTFYAPISLTRTGAATSCDASETERALRSRGPAFRADRFRLEVRVGLDSEMFAFVGGSRFEEFTLRNLLAPGPSSTGALAPVLHQVIESAPEFHFEAEQTVNGWPAYAYSFAVPAERSGHAFLVPDGSRVSVAYQGIIFADRDTGAPVRLSVVVPAPPPAAGCCRFDTELNYHRVRIGSGEFFLPFDALQTFIEPAGARVDSAVSFSSCREYRVESRLVPDVADRQENAAAEALPAAPIIPAGLPVSIRLTGSINSATAAGGDSFNGRLAKALVDASGTVIAPEGALVRGRVVGAEQMRLRMNSQSFITMRLVIETIAIGGRDVPVRLAPRVATPDPGRGGNLQSRGAPIGDLPDWRAMTHAAYSCSGSRCIIRDGTRMEWRTVAQP